MLRFFEPEFDTRWPAAVRRRLTSAPMMVDTMIGERFPATASNGYQSSSQSSSYSVDSIKTSVGGVFISWQDHEVISIESSPDPFLPPFLGERSSTMAADQNDANLRKESSNIKGTKNIEITMRDAKRQKTYLHDEEELHCLSFSFQSTSSTRMIEAARKTQNIGVKIAVLQKLVSPLGKTDTASVLHQATVHIKAMHEKIKLLSKAHAESISYDDVLGVNNGRDQGTKSLRDMGLCLVPISPLINSFANHEPLDRYMRENLLQSTPEKL